MILANANMAFCVPSADQQPHSLFQLCDSMASAIPCIVDPAAKDNLQSLPDLQLLMPLTVSATSPPLS